MPVSEPATATDILLVDDDTLLARALADLLQGRGYPVRLARNGREAMADLARRRPALVISDIFMPEADGFELLAFLGRFTPAPPVLAMTGDGDVRISGMLQMAGLLGAARTIAKPFGAEQFLGLVRELIGVPGGRLPR